MDIFICGAAVRVLVGKKQKLPWALLIIPVLILVSDCTISRGFISSPPPALIGPPNDHVMRDDERQPETRDRKLSVIMATTLEGGGMLHVPEGRRCRKPSSVLCHPLTQPAFHMSALIVKSFFARWILEKASIIKLSYLHLSGTD